MTLWKTHSLGTADLKITEIGVSNQEEPSSFDILSEPLEGFSFPLGGLFESWHCLGEKDSWSLRLSESRLKSGSWGAGSSTAMVFKSWLPALLFLVLAMGGRMAIVCFCLAAQKLDLPWREKEVQCPWPWAILEAWMELLPRGASSYPHGGDLNLSHRREGIIVSRAHLVARRSSHPRGGEGRPEPTSLWTRLVWMLNGAFGNTTNTVIYIHEGESPKKLLGWHTWWLFDLSEPELNKKWLSSPFRWEPEPKKVVFFVKVICF